MDEEKGWRGIIYDAPWARFKKNQEGVFVSEDGKECETLNDDIYSVKLDFDPNQDIEGEKHYGHILFKQKGSDLFDIVCIEQESGGQYQLKVNQLSNVDGCNYNFEQKWQDFINSLQIIEVINGTERELTYDEKVNYVTFNPSKEQVKQLNILTNEDNEVQTVSFTFSKSYNNHGTSFAETTTLIGISPAGEEITTFKEVLFITDNMIPTVYNQGQQTCSLILDSVSVENCIHTVKFKVNTLESNKQYKIPKATVEFIYSIVSCGNDTSTYNVAPDSVTYEPTDNVSIDEDANDYIIVLVQPGTTTFEIKIIAQKDDIIVSETKEINLS